MKEIPAAKKGPRRTYAAKKTAAKKAVYRPEDEATLDDVIAASSKKMGPKPVVRERGYAVPKGQLPAKIEVRQTPEMRSIVPGTVWRTSPFKWDPLPFGLESERLNEKTIGAEVQDKSLRMYLDEPSYPYIYGVAGNPDDGDAKYFAAYLVQAHLQFMGLKANVVWHTLYGDFNNRILKEYDEIDGKSPPTLIVLSNLTPNSTNVKLEKARDIIERFADIPRIIVSAGEDPMSFFTTRLYTPIHALAYFSSTLVKKRFEVI